MPYMNPLLAAMMQEPGSQRLFGGRMDNPPPMAQRPRAAKKPARPGEEEPPMADQQMPPITQEARPRPDPREMSLVLPPMPPMQQRPAPPMADNPPSAEPSVLSEINRFLSPRKLNPGGRTGGLVGSILGSGMMAPVALPLTPLGGLMGGYAGEKIGEMLAEKLGAQAAQDPPPVVPPQPPMADRKMPPLTQEARPRPDPREMSIVFPPMANQARAVGMPGMPPLRPGSFFPKQMQETPMQQQPAQPPPWWTAQVYEGEAPNRRITTQSFADPQRGPVMPLPATQTWEGGAPPVPLPSWAGGPSPVPAGPPGLVQALEFLGAPSWARGEKTTPQYLWQPQSDPAYATKMALLKAQGEQATELEKARIMAAAQVDATKPSASRLMEGLVAKRLENGLPITEQWLNATRGMVDRLYVQPGMGTGTPKPPMSAAAPSAAPAGAAAQERAAALGGSRDLIPEELTPTQMEAAIKTFHPVEGGGLNVEKLGEVLLANQLLYKNLPGLVQTLKRRTITGDPRTEIANEIMRLMEYRGELQDYAPLPSEMHGIKFSSVPSGNTVLGMPTVKSYALETPKVRQEVPITPGYRWSRNSLVPPMLRLRSTQENYGQRIPLLRQLLEEYGAP